MADSVVSSTVTLALENLSRLLVDEVNLLSGVEDEIASLHNELKFIDKFLKNSEGKRSDDVVKEVVSRIRDVADQAEDVVDAYIVKVNKHKSTNMLGKCLRWKDQVMVHHQVNAHIRYIKATIDMIYENKARFDIGEGDFKSDGDNTVEEDAELLRRRRKDVEGEEVVGLMHDSTVVIQKLKETNSRLNVISIMGMGGLGKTTLAREIYNKDEVKDMFPCRAWGYVSYDYRARELLLSLLQCWKSSTYEYKDLSVEQLKGKVRGYLKGKRYLVVLDDIWKIEVWDDLKGAFPDDRNGSRILITSRRREVASYSKATLVYDLPFLSEEDSWQLFTKKVFGEEECPSDLEPMGKTMVESCKGLPLAIILLAGLLARKGRSQREWFKIKDNMNWHLIREGDIMVKHIMKLSYYDLPQRLKPCFLYLGIYPEYYEIPVKELTRQWIAEGFIQPKEISRALELEDVADYYLEELVDCGLVQVASRRSDGGVKTCRTHDLLRDLCISESKTNKFMEVCTELNIDKCSSRRLSLHYKTEFSPTKQNQSHIRSLFFFGDTLHWYSKSKGWKWIRERFKLARVLDLSNVLFHSPPSGLETLIHLRYLRLELYDETNSNNILASICNLWGLETLYLRCDGGVTLPSAIWKLKRLRHVYFKDGILHLPPAQMSRGEDRERMLNLQTLCVVALSPQIASVLNNDSFPNLKTLSLFKYRTHKSWSPQEQLRSLHRLSKLCTLKINGMYDLPLDATMFPSNLNKITLRYCWDLDSRFINTLGQLANLQILKLIDGLVSGSVNCTAGAFPRLEVLHMQNITVRGRWRQAKDAMPYLKHLKLEGTQFRDEEARLKVTSLL